ncbi:9555_t:CDS:2, partial [Dentiscutata heterogama]
MQSELDLLEKKVKEVILTKLKAKNAELIVKKANIEAKNAEYIKLKDETAKLKTKNTKLLTQIIEKYAKNKADRVKLKTGCPENRSKKRKREYKRGRKNGFCIVPFCSCDQYVLFRSADASPTGTTAGMRRLFFMPLNMPISDHSSYHVVVGNHGTGKTTVVRQCARDVGKGVIYVDVPPVLDNFIDKLAKAIGYSFKEYVSFTESFKRKILGNSESAEQPRFFRVLDAFERGARKYKDIAKLYADQSSCIIVFVSSEGTAPRMMMQRSSWSRAEKKPIVIEDLTSKEAFTYLHSKLGIEKKVTNQLIQLLGGRIRDLKEYGNMINRGETFE